MGIISKCQQTLESLTKQQIIFYLDERPFLGKHSSGRLRGWALKKDSAVALQLTIDGIELFLTECNLQRLDVYENHPDYIHSLYSGFCIDFPIHLLEGLGSEVLELWALSGDTKIRVWSWQNAEGSGAGTKTQSLKQFFLTQQREIFSPVFPKKIALNKKNLVHAVIECGGDFPNLCNNLQTISKYENLNAITILIKDAEIANQTQIENLLSQRGIKFSTDIKFNIVEWIDSWEALSIADSVHHLVLYVKERTDLNFLNLPRLIEDFCELSSLPVLMPTVYGENGITGVSGIDLKQLASRKSPIIFPTKKLGPVWLCSLDFLIEIHSENSNLIKQSESILPEEDSLIYHLDLSQPVCVEGISAPNYSLELKQQIEACLCAQLNLSPKNYKTKATTAVLISDRFTKNQFEKDYLSQIKSLVNLLESQGEEVLLVDTSEKKSVSYLCGKSIFSVTELDKTIGKNNLDWIFATDYQSLAYANTLKYLYGGKVSYFIQRFDHLDYQDLPPENAELAFWSYQGVYLPVVNNIETSKNLTEISVGDDRKSEFLKIPVFQHVETYFPQPVERIEGSILFILSSHDLEDVEFKKDFLATVSNLRSKNHRKISIIGAENTSERYLELISQVDQIYPELTKGECARVFSEHEFVVDLRNFEGISHPLLNAYSCGAKVVNNLGENSFSNSFSKQISLNDGLINLLFSDDIIKTNSSKLSEQLKTLSQNLFPNLLKEADQVWEKYRQSLVKCRHERRNISIIIPVYNALQATAMCLRHLLKFAPENSEIILVNDCSDSGTTAWLRNFAKKFPQVRLIEHDKNGGFVQACYTGFKASPEENDILLVNSDVLVTKGCLSSLQDAVYASPETALASSLSTQSPHLQMNFHLGDSLTTAAEKLRAISEKNYPTIITPEGQCLYIRRWALEKFGFFDYVYGRGYCEESDLSMRYFLNGADMVVADDALLLHIRSASFGEGERVSQIHKNRIIFDKRWGVFYKLVYQEFLERDPLSKLRNAYSKLKKKIDPVLKSFSVEDIKSGFDVGQTGISFKSNQLELLKGGEVVFILPSLVHGGGTISVLQHVDELQMRGVEAKIFALTETDLRNRPHLAPGIPICSKDLLRLNWTDQKIVSTFWTTAYLVKSICAQHKKVSGFYYIQDYEPWFYSRPEEFPLVELAEKTYSFGLTGVAKTEYLRKLLQSKHQLDIELVNPGLNHLIYYPGDQDQYFGPVRIAGMYRAKTPRRGNKELEKLLLILKERLPELQINLFGDTGPFPESLDGICNFMGRVTPDEVSKLYRQSDLVIDLSYWHGFGRMGVEGMACGAVPILSSSGGIDTYAENNKNSLIVDTADLEETANRIIKVIKDRNLRLKLREAALESASQFSEFKAVSDWLKVLGEDSKEDEITKLVSEVSTREVSIKPVVFDISESRKSEKAVG
jgi:GT2 family glycosyltransferase